MNIVVPQLGESVIEARVAKWLKKAGDAVSQGDALVELETDKIDLEVNAEASGVLARIDQAEGADVKVLGVIEEVASTSVSKPDTNETKPVQPDEPRTNQPEPAPTRPNQTEPGSGPDVRATPTAKKVAADLGVDVW